MTDKERLDALTMNLELLFRETQEMRQLIEGTAQLTAQNSQAIAQNSQAIAQNNQAIAELRVSQMESRVQMDATREMVMSIAQSTQRLLVSQEAALGRIERLERKAG